MPRNEITALFQDPKQQMFTFKLDWNGVVIELEAFTRGKVWVRNMSDLRTAADHDFFSRVSALGERISRSSDKPALISELQQEIARRALGARIQMIKRLPGLVPKRVRPLDHFSLQTKMQPPAVLTALVPSINEFLLNLSYLCLIPGVMDSNIGKFIAVSFSAVSALALLATPIFEKKFGIVGNIQIQDALSVVPLSVAAFSSGRIITSMIESRVLLIPRLDQDPRASLIAGSVAIAMGGLHSIVSLFRPPISIMGPRRQREALHILEQALDHTSDSVTTRESIISKIKEASVAPGIRFFCRSRQVRHPDYMLDERIVKPSSLFTMAGRLGTVFTLSFELSRTFGFDPLLCEVPLMLIVLFGFLYPYLDRVGEVSILPRGRAFFTSTPLSSWSLSLAKALKYASEGSSVAFFSIISPIVQYAFVLALFDKNLIASLAVAAGIAMLSLWLDLFSRHLGLDRSEGWTPSRLRYILDNASRLTTMEAQSQLLALMFNHAQTEVAPAGATAVTPAAGSSSTANSESPLTPVF